MATVYELPRATMQDSANVLRCIADEIETGKYGDIVASVIILEANGIELFGSGCADLPRAVLLLELAKQKLILKRLGVMNLDPT